MSKAVTSTTNSIIKEIEGKKNMTKSKVDKKEKLRICHIPQLGYDFEFYVPVETAEEGLKMMYLLTCYDLYQLENNIKPDFYNLCDLQKFNEETQEWEDYYDEYGCDVTQHFDGNKEMEKFSKILFGQLRQR